MRVKYKNNSLLEHYILFEGVSLNDVTFTYVIKDSAAFKYIKQLGYKEISEPSLGNKVGLSLSFKDNDDKEQIFDFCRVKKSSGDHHFIMTNRNSKEVKANCSFTTSSIINNTRMFNSVKIAALSNQEKEFYGKILLKFINKLKNTQAYIGFIIDNIDYEFYQVLLDTGKFQRTKDNKYIVNGISSPEEKTYITAPDTEKNNPVGGTRDWENKSSGLKRNRKDRMPGGNTRKDYTTKGDHGQAGLDMLATALDKTGDYVLDKEASKKYRV